MAPVESQALAEDQQHALACPTCGGIPELVHDYNRHSNPSLPDPVGKLHIPLFAHASEASLSSPDGPASAPDRSAPPALESHDWTAIAAALAEKQHRRDAYHGGVLWIAVLRAMLRQYAQHWRRQACRILEWMWQRWGRNAWPHWAGLPVAYRRCSLVLAGVLLLSLGWTLGHFSARLRPAAEHSLSGNRAGLFNAYQFQQSIRSTDIGTLVSAHAVLEEPPYLLGLAAPAKRAMFVRAGVHYATLLAYLHSNDLAQATQHLDLLVQMFDTLPTLLVLTHYLDEMRMLLHSQQYSGVELGQFVGLFEPLFTAQYRGEFLLRLGQSSQPRPRAGYPC